MFIRTFVAALVFVLSLATAAHADSVLFAGPIMPGTTEGLQCLIANVGKTVRMVSIAVLLEDGSEMHATPSTAVVTPGRTTSFAFFGVPARTCRFIVEGSKTGYRATACTRDAGGPIACVSAQ
jgi:hypothetical protein